MPYLNKGSVHSLVKFSKTIILIPFRTLIFIGTNHINLDEEHQTSTERKKPGSLRTAYMQGNVWLRV